MSKCYWWAHDWEIVHCYYAYMISLEDKVCLKCGCKKIGGAEEFIESEEVRMQKYIDKQAERHKTAMILWGKP